MFRLALALGRTVQELGRSVTVSELREWWAYYNLEPFGPLAEDWRHGIACDVAAKTQGAKRRKARHHMLSKEAKRRTQSPDEIMAALSGLVGPRPADA